MTAAFQAVTSPPDTRFAELVERQSRFVYRVAFAIVRNRQDAEDVVQDTFLKLYRLGAWEGINDERAFLARTAWRLAVGRRKRDPEAVREPASGANPESDYLVADRNALVHRMIDSLPEELRQPLVLSGLDEMNSREIAVVMEIPEGTVRTRIARARQMLKQKLAGCL